jgi:hypothetical protein
VGTATPTPNTDPENELDAILADIDKLVDHQCKRATTRKRKAGDPPSGPVEIAHFKKTRAVFQAMSESSLNLSESSGNLPAMPAPQEDETPEEDGEETISVLRPTTWFPRAKKHLG